MRLSHRSRNSVKHKSASAELADQTGGRLLTKRLEFKYKNESKLSRHDVQILRSFFVGPANSLFYCCRVSTSVYDCRIEVKNLTKVEKGSRHSTFVKKVGH